MAEVKPFKGLLYDPDKVGGEYAHVCAPPYDVISAEDREDLLSRSEYNVVHLTLPEGGGPGSSADKYANAGNIISTWIEQGVLRTDQTDSFYVYSQEYCVDGKKFRRTGFIGLMKIDEPGEVNVIPHEHTLSKPKKDRLNLIEEVKCDLSSIFAIYSDDSGEISEILSGCSQKSEPVMDFHADDVRHILWRISAVEEVNKISRLMSDKKVFIADGHHRYAVAKKYRDQLRAAQSSAGGAEYVMMYFADMNVKDNLTVLATHRALRKMPGNGISGLEKFFKITEMRGIDELMSKLSSEKSRTVFGFADPERTLFVEPEEGVDFSDLIEADRSVEWKNLDVSVLHTLIFGIMGVSREEGDIVYVKTAEDAVSMLENGDCEGVFLLNPTPVEQLKAVALKDDMMPQKSTYFYPKLFSGLVMYKF